MKKILLVLMLCITLFGCNQNNEKQTNSIIDMEDIIIYIGDEKQVFTKSSEYSIAGNNEFITMSENGLLTGKAVGEADLLIIPNRNNTSYKVHVIVKNRTINIKSNITSMLIGEEYRLEIETIPSNNAISWNSSDKNIAKVENGYITALNEGLVTISVTIDGYDTIKDEINLSITKPEKEKLIITGEEYCLLNKTIQLNTNSLEEIIWESSNVEIASVENGEVIPSSIGTVTIYGYILGYEESKATIDIDICEESKDYLIDNTSGYVISNHVYYSSSHVFSDIKTVLDKSDESLNIIVNKNIDNDIIINRNNVTLYGSNKNNKGFDERQKETLLKSIIINQEIKNIVINGFEFTSSSIIELKGSNENIVITCNYIHDTTQNSKTWVENNNFKTGIILLDSSTIFHNNIEISNNYFNNIFDAGVNYSSIHEFKVINNVFNKFAYDAVRSTDGTINKDCQWLFKDNKFEDGKYNGLYFRTFGSDGITAEHIISIFNNTFKNVGQTEVLFSGAISFRTYMEGATSVNISYNEFNNCKNYILLRNNAKELNQKNFSAYITNNIFLGIPNNYYFKNVNNSDTVATNPTQTIFDGNYFGNINGTVVDLNAQTNKFINVKSNRNICNNINDVSKIIVYGKHVGFVGESFNMISNDNITWTSSDNNILEISSLGKGVCKKEGVVTLSAHLINTDEILNFEVNIKETRSVIEKLIQIALNEEGYQETIIIQEEDENYTKYGEWYGLNPGAWCAMFVSWCSNQAGIPRTIIPKYASVSTGMKWFIDKKLFVYKEGYTPKCGDIIFFKNEGASHTGIVISSDGTKVYTIEGNTNDVVAQRNYLLTYNKITGYGTPLYPISNNSGYNFDVSSSTDGSSETTR